MSTKHKLGKLAKLEKINSVMSKKITKQERTERPKTPKKKQNTPHGPPDHSSTNKLLDYMEKRRAESNILPLSGPNIPQNFITCKFYALNGRCNYGSKCRFLHNFAENINIETAEPAVRTFAASPFQDFSLPKRLVITHFKVATQHFQNGQSATFIAVAHEAQIINIYSLNHLLPVQTYRFPLIDKLLDFDFSSLASSFDNNEKPKKGQAADPNFCMLTIHVSNHVRLYNLFTKRCLKRYELNTEELSFGRKLIYKIEHVHPFYHLMDQQTKKGLQPEVAKKLKKLKEISTWMIINESGGIWFIDARKGRYLCDRNLGVHINEIIFMNLQTGKGISSDYSKDIKQLAKMPENAVVAGKGIHVWDFVQKKLIRKISYNMNAYYLSVAGIEVTEGNEKKQLIVATGKLQNNIIAFGDEIFIEIWNPITGGCVKRIIESKLTLQTGPNAPRLNPFSLNVIPNGKEWLAIVNSENKIEIWDLFQEKMLFEFSVNNLKYKIFIKEVSSQNPSFLTVNWNSNSMLQICKINSQFAFLEN